jgi:hypothetical protein
MYIKHFIIIRPSNKPGKKLEAVIDGKTTVAFGAKGYEDFTTHKDEDRKQRYIKRHAKAEDWTDPLTAGFYSRWILWSKPTILESIQYVNRRFPNIAIKWSNV